MDKVKENEAAERRTLWKSRRRKRSLFRGNLSKSALKEEMLTSAFAGGEEIRKGRWWREIGGKEKRGRCRECVCVRKA